ncbi:MAG: ribonuclease HII [Nanoarchaeota archaeon]
MVKILGIDEAGRGPVIGPMVIAGVMIEQGKEITLGGVKDSKLLSQKKRILLDKHIRQNSKFEIIIVEPEIIDAAIFSNELNLNWLEAHKQAEIINKLSPDKVIIDCPSINCAGYTKYLSNLIKNKKIELVIEHKADVNYPVCSAASILAKVKREEEMGNIKRKYGITGSGYPADPATNAFIKNNWNKCPEIFRKSWATYRKYSNPETNPKEQKGLGDF